MCRMCSTTETCPKRNSMKKWLVVGCCLLFILTAILGCKSPDQVEQDVRDSKTTQEIVFKQELEREVRTAKVIGVGKVVVTPDVATVELSVSVQAPTAEEAQQRNSEQMAAVLEVIKQRGIRDENIKTQEVAVYPVQDTEKNAAEIIGYSASNTINIRIHRVNATGEVVAAAMQAGANELLHVEFHLLDETEAYKEALIAAVEDAQQKAEVLVGPLGADLNGPGFVTESTNFSQDSNNIVRYETQITGEQVDGSSILETPLQAGQITVMAEVTVEYMLKYPATPVPTPIP